MNFNISFVPLGQRGSQAARLQQNRKFVAAAQKMIGGIIPGRQVVVSLGNVPGSRVINILRTKLSSPNLKGDVLAGVGPDSLINIKKTISEFTSNPNYINPDLPVNIQFSETAAGTRVEILTHADPLNFFMLSYYQLVFVVR